MEETKESIKLELIVNSNRIPINSVNLLDRKQQPTYVQKKNLEIGKIKSKYVLLQILSYIDKDFLFEELAKCKQIMTPFLVQNYGYFNSQCKVLPIEDLCLQELFHSDDLKNRFQMQISQDL
eukprot:403349880